MKIKKVLRLAVLAVFLGIWATASTAAAAFYNFDNLPSPGPSPLELPGVTFTPKYLAGRVVAIPWSKFPGDQAFWFESINDTPFDPVLTITFDQPIFLVKFQIIIYILAPVKIDALDSHGNLLDSYEIKFSEAVSHVILCAKGIKSVVVKSQSSAWIDGFSFSPQPSGAAIIPLN